MITRFETFLFAVMPSHLDSRRIYGLLTFVQISQSKTSHLSGTLGAIALNVNKGGVK